MPASQTSYRSIVAIILALITYGSVYPLSISLEATSAEAWKHFWTTWGDNPSLSNLVANIALFVPLGFFAAPRREPGGRRAGPFIAILLWGTLFALALQIIQIAIPVRDAALADVFWNAMGLGIGLALGSATLRGRWLGALKPPAAMASLVVIGLWGAAELVPLVPSIDPQLIKDSLKPLFLQPRFSLTDTLAAAIGVGVLGHALARLKEERASLLWLLGIAALVLAVKPFILVVELDLSVVMGFGLGCVAWGLLLYVDERQRAILLLTGLLIVLTVTRLEPFQLAHTINAMEWIPFAEVLEGSMLINSRSLVSSLFLYTATLWLVRLRGRSLSAAGLLLGLWVALLEVAQMFIVGRTPSITEPLWVLAVAVTLAHLTDTARPAGGARAIAPSPGHPTTLAPAKSAQTQPWRRVLVRFGVTAAMGAIPLWVIVQLPGVPYNLRELLHGGSNPLAAWVFVLALLWVGAGAAWMGHQIHGSRWPIVRIPITAFAAAMVSLLLLSLSVTQESILDIAGSNNLHWFVTNRDIWGEQARVLFLAVGPNVVPFFERPVRYAALYGPVVIFLAIAHAAWLQRHDGGTAIAARVGWLALSALPWLLLCKTIALDWSSTDNLNELIARQGPLGIHGDYFILALTALLAANATLVAHVRTLRTSLIALLATLIVVPIAWWLLNQGLADQVQKYGLTFSGIQFLLGPDRSDLLSDEALLARWVAVQIAAVMVFALGLRLATPIFEPAARPKKPTQVRPKSKAPDNAAITANLNEQQIDFLNQVAKQLELDFQGAIRRVVDVVLDEHTNSTLAAQLSHPTAHQADNRGQQFLERTIVLREDQAERIKRLAADAGVSSSCTLRRAVRLFMEGIARDA